MVKLVRMVSNDVNGFFESKFNSNILIEPNSKIGLLSFSGTLAPIQEFINQESIFFYPYSAFPGVTITARIPNAVYNASNYQTLLDNVEKTFNNTNAIIGTTQLDALGSQFRCAIVNGKPEIEYKIAYNANEIVEYFITNNIDYNPQNVFSSQNAGSNTFGFTANLIGRYPIAQSTGYHSVRIDKLVGEAGMTFLKNNGFIIGFSKTDFATTGGIPNEAQIDFSIGVSSIDGGATFTMYRQEDATPTDLNQAPYYAGEGDLTNSELIIYKDGANIVLAYTDNNGDVQELYTYVDAYSNINDPLYPFVAVKSDDNYIKCLLEGTSFDPYILPLEEQEETDSVFINPIMNGNQDPHAFRYDLTLAPKFAKFFGFEAKSYQQTQEEVDSHNTNPPAPDLASFTIIANNNFRPALETTSYLLEIFNINLESYDSSQKQRKNILSSLIINIDGDRVVKEDGGVIYLDIANKEAVDLRNIKLRFVDNDYKSVEMEGTSIATLLLADKSDSSF